MISWKTMTLDKAQLGISYETQKLFFCLIDPLLFKDQRIMNRNMHIMIMYSIEGIVYFTLDMV